MDVDLHGEARGAPRVSHHDAEDFGNFLFEFTPQ
jgi:hypothetical protein